MRMTAVLALLVLAACSRAPAADVAHGKRLATVMGCVSCHGPKLDGHLFEENPAFAVTWSSNLSRILPDWSEAQIEATLRTGRRPSGSALWFMPTFAQSQLSASDMRDLVGYLRTGLVVRERWLDDVSFVELLSISQTMPGLNAVNMSILVGDRLRGGLAVHAHVEFRGSPQDGGHQVRHIVVAADEGEGGHTHQLR